MQNRPDGPNKESQDTTEEDTKYITGFKLAGVLGSITLVVFLLLLDQSILSTAIPQITSQFHSLQDVGWYAGVYQLCNAALQPLTGKIYSNFSLKWAFLIFVFIFELGSLISGLAVSSLMLILGRVVAGIGASGLLNGGLTIIAAAAPLHKRPLYTGIIMGFGQVGIVSGPLIGGALTQYATWRWCFYINLPIGGVSAFLFALLTIPEITAKEPFSWALVRKVIPELDLVGFVLFAPAVIMFLLALQFGGGGDYAWDSSEVIGLFVGAAAKLVLFGLWERRRGDRAMLPGRIIKDRIVWSSTLQITTAMGALITASYYMPIYFQSVRGASPIQSGVYVLPSILSQLCVAVLSGIAVSKMGYYLPWVVGGTALTTVACGLISTWTPWTETGKWIGYQILAGAGRGATMQMGMIAVQNAVDPSVIPVAIALLITFQTLGSAVTVVIADVAFNEELVRQLGFRAPSVSPDAALAAGGGAEAVRSLVPPGSPELDGVLLSYSNAFNVIFYVIVGFMGLSFLASFGMGWVDTRKPKQKQKQAAAQQSDSDPEQGPTGSVSVERREKEAEHVDLDPVS
ncbi:major facilitator superfamily domain-containing protein [Xylariomycetidae sp. FL2044]|nr:major facilitator superfamily domain-containing protein [Xylariomycetidae sp. FL2044]